LTRLAQGHIELQHRLKEHKKKSEEPQKRAKEWHPLAETFMKKLLKEGTMSLRGIRAKWFEENPSESL
jgi:hypothetical protein